MTAPRIFLYVQHLLGIGHIQRAAALARAFSAAGMAVDFVSGGLAVPGLDIGAARFHQLPPVRARGDGDWTLVDAAGAAVGESGRAARRDALLAIYQETRPAAVIVEMFPFGRRQMRFELLPLLAAARDSTPRPLVLCSVRDVLHIPARPGRAEASAALVEEYFDFVMVHGDRRILPLEASFPAAARIAGKLRYTGYVAAPPADRPKTGTGEVLVSAGGGAVGRALLETALAARELTVLSATPWRLLAGRNMADRVFDGLRAAAPTGVTVERARTDFAELLAGCVLSVSQAGYNTVMDVLAASARAIVVPFVGDGETEQTTRAARFSELGLLRVLPEAELAPATLAAAIDAAIEVDPANAESRTEALARIDLTGAATSARLVAGWLAERGRG